MSQEKHDRESLEVERIQTGVRLEKRMLKVLKAIAEQKDMTLGDLLLENRIVFLGSSPETGGNPAITVRRFATPHGVLLAVDGAMVEDLFSDANAAWACWRRA